MAYAVLGLVVLVPIGLVLTKSVGVVLGGVLLVLAFLALVALVLITPTRAGTRSWSDPVRRSDNDD